MIKPILNFPGPPISWLDSAPVCRVWSELHNMSSLKREQRLTLKAFLCCQPSFGHSSFVSYATRQPEGFSGQLCICLVGTFLLFEVCCCRCLLTVSFLTIHKPLKQTFTFHTTTVAWDFFFPSRQDEHYDIFLKDLLCNFFPLTISINAAV